MSRNGLSRKGLIFAAAALAMAGAGTVQAADWGIPADPIFRPAYPVTYEQEDPLGFEVGLRYWYSMGAQAVMLNNNPHLTGVSAGTEDTSHILELHGRIDDHSTATYLKGALGFNVMTEGQYFTADGNLENIVNGPSLSGGSIEYGGADFGYMPFGNDTFRFGGFVGYQFWRDMPDANRQALYGVTGPDIHALRLGIAARADFNDMIDFQAEVAAVPLAWASGSLTDIHFANTDLVGNGDLYNRVSGQMDGTLYGGMAEAMVGFRPNENFAIRGGLRGWLLTGPATFTLAVDNSNDPGVPALQTGVTEDVGIMRWGPVVELTARF